MIILNLILTFLIIAGLSGAIYLYLTRSKAIVKDTDGDALVINKASIHDLAVLSARSIGSFLRQDFSNQNLTEAEYNNKNAAKKRLRHSLAEAAYGDAEAKTIIKEYIKSIITTSNDLRVSEVNIGDYIAFDEPEQLSASEKFFILLTAYQKYEGSGSLSKMFKDLGFADQSLITDKMIDEGYEKLSDLDFCQKCGYEDILTEFSYDEKLDYLTQEIFQSIYGFGVIDRLLETDIDEIDGGISGLPVGTFTIDKASIRNAKFSSDAVWILFHGHNIHLDCLSFESAEEIERVCENVYKYNAQQVFSRSKGFVVSSMKNGSRVVVVRPPFADKFAFFVRKFDSAPSIAPESLIVGEGNEILRTLCEWFVRGQRNIAITGQQGTGKTTMLKAFIRWIENLNIRTQELAFEMNLSFAYPEKNILSFQETDTVTAQAGLNVQKKTNGAVNIVGEVADAEQASHIIQTANVASLFAMFTHHAKSTSSLVNMIALNLLQLGLYKEKRDAVEISAQTLNVNVHLENTDTYRHIEFIDEIIPVTDVAYPSEEILKNKAYDPDAYTVELGRLDEREYYKRMTDRKLFLVNNIVKWNRIPGEKNPRIGFYTLEHMPSKEMLADMRNRLTDPQLKQRFDDDMEKIQQIDREIRQKYAQYIQEA